jgi:glycogen phosphorylase/synthase
MKEQQTMLRPDYIFEVSWEICNKVGGIHTVLMTKAPYLEKQLGINYMLIGPEIQDDGDDNSVFIEDTSLYQQWVEFAADDGLHVRIGRWNMESAPLTILVNFSEFFQHKDDVFASMWETYKLDSIKGDWSYIEPSLFGYVAAKVVESFYKFYISAYDKMIVHFHDWKTGMGLLYLKKNVPQAALVFTTHDSIPGRVLSAKRLPAYEKNNDVNPDELIDKAGDWAKFNLERLSIFHADIHTAVSQLHADEMKLFYGRNDVIVTPNGFDGALLPQHSDFQKFKDDSREKLMAFLSKFFQKSIDKNSFLLFHGGRYDFYNKGTNVFIDTLKKLKDQNIDKEIIAVISIPANHSGATESVKKRIAGEVSQSENELVTHHLLSYEQDLIIEKLKENKLLNHPDDKVKVVFIPAWLNGNDGVVNISYFEVLAGVDLSVFPSSYESWGHAPMESLFCGVPTITTDKTGFGLWAKSEFPDNLSIKVLSHENQNHDDFVSIILNEIFSFLKNDQVLKNDIQRDAKVIAQATLWDNFISEYYKAYHYALEKARQRADMYSHKQALPLVIKTKSASPLWHKILVKPHFSDILNPLRELSQNLWWSWNHDAFCLFESINPQLWKKTEQNPIALIEMLGIDDFKKLEQDNDFIQRMNEVYARFQEYMSEKPSQENLVAYFCMEYGLHVSVKLYSGGLGILAGDYLKEASDMNKNFIAVGLLYRYGYFNQKISAMGDQVNEKIPQKFTHLPIVPVRNEDEKWVHVSLSFPGRMVHAKVWLMKVGRISLYLLDTDIEENSEFDRTITHQLYGGDWENRLKQELLLGIGGVRMLRSLNIQPQIFHLNEGHAAFLNLERLRFLIQEEKMSYYQAIEVLRATSLFTTHTPVPAGHDSFDESLLRVYLSHYPQRYNISWEKFVGLGRVNAEDIYEKFSMSVLALRLSQECNGVSRLHGKVSRSMFQNMFQGYFSDELHISHVTNGVHYPTWTGVKWMNLLTDNNLKQLGTYQDNHEKWEHFQTVDNEKIWNIRSEYKSDLISFLQEKLVIDYTSRQEQPHLLIQTLDDLKPDVLTIGFARRFATYKRATLLFQNPERLSRIVNDPLKPVRFVFAGKAHPKDTQGQQLIKEIINYSKQPEFIGKIIFIDNYDAEIAKTMVKGVDVWLNTPMRPMEASGTSGEKCIMNGVLHFSVLDGWWAEGYVPNAGWALKENKTYSDQTLQNQLDAETIYNTIETEIAPIYYNRNQNNIPEHWIQLIKNNFSKVAPNFTMRRMMNDYYNQFYIPMFERSKQLMENNYEKAHMLAAWKRRTSVMWENVKIVENNCHNSTLRPLMLGEMFHAEVKIDTAGIPATEIGVELLFGQKIMDKVDVIDFAHELEVVDVIDNIAVFNKPLQIKRAGVLDYAIRVFVKHPLLKYKTDYPLVKWG